MPTRTTLATAVAAATVLLLGTSPALAATAPEDTQASSRSSSTPASDLALQPFAPTSVWKLGIARSAGFESEQAPQTAALLGGNPITWINQDNHSHPVVQARDWDPMATVTDVNGSQRSATYRIPADAAIAPGSDRHLHVVSPDGRTVHEAWQVQRLSPTSYRVGRLQVVDLAGSGIGPANGTKAYGGSAIGGLVRAWEVDPNHPAYTGQIRHPIAMALPSDRLLHTGHDGRGNTGYTWPATEQDSDSSWSYRGPVPMGSYFAIPPDVDLTRLGLTGAGLMLARAYQDYGGYVTDRSGATTLAYVEPSAPGAFADALLGPNYNAHDLRKIRALLRRVTTNGSGTPNGGPLNTPRRGGTSTSAAPAVAPAPAPVAPARAPVAPAPSAPASAGGNPFAGARGYADPLSMARREADARRRWDPAGADALSKLADGSVADWYGDWIPIGSLAGRVGDRVSTVTAAGALPVLVVYATPGLDCGGYSAGGVTDDRAYREWITQFVAGIGNRKAVVVLEPDSLAQLDCLPADRRAGRTALLAWAAAALSAQPNTAVYLDAGHSSWLSAQTMATRLTAAGVDRIRGFAINVSNFQTTAASTAYGEQVSALLGGKHFIVDTSRNGAGPGDTWCNPAGRALGVPLTTDTGSPYADALLWIKRAGESDGSCNGGPPAGQFWTDYAIGLGQRAG